jgi:hypothetical protein
LAPRARFELATLRLTAGVCKTLNALFGVAYDREHLKSRPSVGQLLGNLLKRKKARVIGERVGAVVGHVAVGSLILTPRRIEKNPRTRLRRMRRTKVRVRRLQSSQQAKVKSKAPPSKTED